VDLELDKQKLLV